MALVARVPFSIASSIEGGFLKRVRTSAAAGGVLCPVETEWTGAVGTLELVAVGAAVSAVVAVFPRVATAGAAPDVRSAAAVLQCNPLPSTPLQAPESLFHRPIVSLWTHTVKCPGAWRSLWSDWMTQCSVSSLSSSPPVDELWRSCRFAVENSLSLCCSQSNPKSREKGSTA